MSDVKVTVAVEDYFCQECFDERGAYVTALLRMIPRSTVFNGRLVGDEYWCCVSCNRAKFTMKRERWMSLKQKNAQDKKPTLRLVRPAKEKGD
jgi:hypothetical protein